MWDLWKKSLNVPIFRVFMLARRGPQSDGMRLLHPFLDANLIVMQSGLTSNCGEFAIIKIGIIDGFPDTKKLDGIAISQPIRDEKVSIFCLQHIGKGDEINIPS